MSSYDALLDFAGRNCWGDEFLIRMLCEIIDNNNLQLELEKIFTEQEDFELSYSVDEEF